MESQQSLNIVLRIPNSEIYLVQNEEIHSLVKGTMNLVELPAHDSYIISLDDFGYTLSKEIPVMAKKLASGESIYILPNVQGHFGLKLPVETNPQLISAFEGILKNFGEFIADEQPLLGGAKQAANAPATTDDSPKAKEIVPEDAEDSDIVVKSGEVIRDGLIKAATFAAGGIAKAGTFLIQRLMKKSEDVEVKESTQQKIRFAKSTTTTIAVFTASQMKNVLSVAGTIVKKIGNSIESSNESQGYHKAMTIGKSAVQAAATVYDGMREATGVITKELAKTTTEAVTFKYGQKLGDATTEVFEIVENVGNVYGGISRGVVKALASKEKMLIAVN